MRIDLKNARVEKGLTQTQLAELIGKDQGIVSRYENGKSTFGADTAKAIAETLGLSVLDVLYPPQTRSRRKAA